MKRLCTVLAYLVLFVAAIASLSIAQEVPGTITTVAGNGRQGFSGDGGPAAQASLNAPTGIAVDAKGNIYFSEVNSHRVRRISPDGVITTFAGAGVSGFSGDGGPATQASLNGPRGVAVDASGNLYIADALNFRVRRVGPDGVITTFAGTAATGTGGIGGTFSGDGGPATQAGLLGISALAADRGNVFIVGGNRVRRVGTDGFITTVAGTGGIGFSGDGGPAAQASFRMNNGTGVAMDAKGNLYIADPGNSRVRRVGTDGIITTFAGTGAPAFNGPNGDGGPATQGLIGFTNGAEFGVAVDVRGVVYIFDTGTHRVRRVGLDGIITTLAGTGAPAFSGDGGPAAQAALEAPNGVAIGPDGAIYIADTNNHRIRRISPLPSPDIRLLISSLALDSAKVGSTSQKTFTISNPGNASLSVFGIALEGTDAPEFRVSATTATVPAGDSVRVTVTFNPASAGLKSARLTLRHSAGGEILTVSLTGTAQEVSGPGIIKTYAGTGTGGSSRDGDPASRSLLSAPTGIVLDAAGAVYIADLGSNRIRKVGPDGILTTVAGTGTAGFSGDDGPAAQATLNQPSGVAVDGQGNLYIADRGNNRIRKVGKEGVITTFAGTGNRDFGGDGAQARFAALSQPSGVAVDGQGNLYIADRGNNRVRRVGKDGRIETVAGTQSGGFSGDGGGATLASLDSPRGVAVDAKGNLYVADWGNRRVRRVGPDGAISTFAGTGKAGYSGDGGQALQADLYDPSGVSTDNLGNVYIADTGNGRIRKVGADGRITTLAGGGSSLGDGGPAQTAGLRDPTSVAVDAHGNLFIAEAGDHRIRRMEALSAQVTIPSRSADFDNSGRVDLDDFFLFAGGFGQRGEGGNERFDLDGSGQVDFTDFFLFAEKFGQRV